MQNLDVVVSAVGLAPFLVYGGPTGISGCDVEIISILAQKLEFRYKFKFEEYWGRDLGGGAWDGTLGSVSVS